MLYVQRGRYGMSRPQMITNVQQKQRRGARELHLPGQQRTVLLHGVLFREHQLEIQRVDPGQNHEQHLEWKCRTLDERRRFGPEQQAARDEHQREAAQNVRAQMMNHIAHRHVREQHAHEPQIGEKDQAHRDRQPDEVHPSITGKA